MLPRFVRWLFCLPGWCLRVRVWRGTDATGEPRRTTECFDCGRVRE